jgi:hypothetical protein
VSVGRGDPRGRTPQPACLVPPRCLVPAAEREDVSSQSQLSEPAMPRHAEERHATADGSHTPVGRPPTALQTMPLPLALAQFICSIGRRQLAPSSSARHRPRNDAYPGAHPGAHLPRALDRVALLGHDSVRIPAWRLFDDPR